MTYKTILVPLCGSDNDPVALKGAVMVARDFDAHLVGLFVRLDPRDAVPMLGEGMSGAMVDEIMRAAETESNSHRAAARRHFDEAVAAAGFELRDVPGGVEAPSAAWRDVVGRIEDIVPAEARLADLIVCAHTSIDADTQGYATMETALLGSARPVLLIPKDIPAEIGRTVAVAWNGKVEATRAVAAALPFLRSADRAHVLTAETSATDAAAGRRMADYLAWQGVNPELTILHPGSEPVGETVTKKAAELGADLLVMGGYGHSRVREMILGGVTRYVLNHAGLPVLMAH
ncbi:universal stress protein [Azospirillum picis]|uniref:Nucleotide-binding universal stress UspA family protein n=1 Tax=Azospirillum picis TaxID=488438 RepID=A0ABU0MUD2_9PROT|nr:universal stress protein [Azospirillum picis]MBP2303273.1 nucleotide-binding universal stress UspA family protein [Azospirillum picis]MDQ0537103.1 nucleotide-binding universal stress UspA family protein [Azospirillum picis]